MQGGNKEKNGHHDHDHRDDDSGSESNDNENVFKKRETSSLPLPIGSSTIYDLSHSINPEMPTYVGEPKPEFHPHFTIKNNKVNVTKITMGSHTGTHVDAPKHFLLDGIGIDEASLTRFIGEAVVADFSEKGVGHGINSKDLEKCSASIDIRKSDILLIYTGTSDLWDNKDADSARTAFSYLDPSGADWIVSRGIKCVGIDSFSMEKYGFEEGKSHKKLLSNGIGIVEGLNNTLKMFAGRRVFFVCIPLRLEGLDGSPVRPLIFTPTQGMETTESPRAL